MPSTPQAIELLAPARDAATAIEAIRHGADAVYIGPPDHGARAAASNTIDDLKRVCDYAHTYDARVYATVNTLVYDDELPKVERMVNALWRAGVDALIVQDLSLLRLDIPPIDLHASTQCDIRTPERAAWLAACGFSQLVLPRELTLAETAAVRRAVPAAVALEAFVHGALCVSYSGDCQASCVATGRSANRGECAQICRLPFDLVDASGRVLIERKHLLSLRDLDRHMHIGGMLEAGVTSFKIEGRLKDTSYVKNVTAYYSRLFDRICEESDGRWRRSSSGVSVPTFTPDLNLSFNRGYTSYFTTGERPHGVSMASIDTPKWRGEAVGTVRNVRGRQVTAKLTAPLANGDGLGYMAADGTFCGFRANRVEGDRAMSASDLTGLRPGAVLYRNRDAMRDKEMAGVTATRRISVEMTLRTDAARRLVVDVADHRSSFSMAEADDGQASLEEARTPQEDSHRRVMTKTGDTPYEVVRFDDRIPHLFVPASRLTALRRAVTERYGRARLMSRPVRLRRPLDNVPPLHVPAELTYHDNVANRISRAIYEQAGAIVAQPALETLPQNERRRPGRVVMTTRYCLRRELDSCLRDAAPPRKLPDGPLWLRGAAGLRLKLNFDCKSCCMHVINDPTYGDTTNRDTSL